MQKTILNQNGVSAVIGVIIMVAITVAMAAVAYAYFTGMIGESKTETPVISFTPSASEKTITVASADTNINWRDINITFTDGTSYDYLEKTDTVSAGDVINLNTDQSLTGTVIVTFRYNPTNTLMGDAYTFQNVS
jgi:flagellin-like protein